jgi:hypothetical protein
MKCYIWIFSENLSKKPKSHQNLGRVKGYFTLRPRDIFYHISFISSFDEKHFRQKLQRKSKGTFCVQYLFFLNRTVYEIKWINILERARPQMTIWRTRVACWTPRATDVLCVWRNFFLLQANTFVPARLLFCTNLAVNKGTPYLITFVNSLVKQSQTTLIPKHRSPVAANLPVQYWGKM